MRIRPAELADLNACILLDGSYQTDHVWQMEQREQDGEISISFRQVALPRVVTVAYPAVDAALVTHWQRGDCVLVAELDNEVLGFWDMTALADQGLGWVHHLVVARAYRRRGIGSALLRHGARWAQANGLERMMFVVQSKNYPGICFCQKFGFEFCGFSDRYFGNQDIALLFGRDLHTHARP